MVGIIASNPSNSLSIEIPNSMSKQSIQRLTLMELSRGIILTRALEHLQKEPSQLGLLVGCNSWNVFTSVSSVIGKPLWLSQNENECPYTLCIRAVFGPIGLYT